MYAPIKNYRDEMKLVITESKRKEWENLVNKINAIAQEKIEKYFTVF